MAVGNAGDGSGWMAARPLSGTRLERVSIAFSIIWQRSSPASSAAGARERRRRAEGRA